MSDYCCRDMEDNREAFEYYGDHKIIRHYGWTISTYEDHWYRLKNINYCPFCGEDIK
jgi:hypothetical protein